MATQDNPQLLFTLSDPPIYDYGFPCRVVGVVMLENFVYVLYYEHKKIEVFDCEDCYKKVKDIEVEGMKEPEDMVGSSVTSQLFISKVDDVIRRVDLKTGVCDVFVKVDDGGKIENNGSSFLSLVENRLLLTSRDSLMIYDIHSGERIKNISLTEDWKKNFAFHAIESNRDSFFVIHIQPENNFTNTVREIDAEGRVIRVFNNEQQIQCAYLALDSVGRLLVVDLKDSGCVFLLDEHLKFERILLDYKQLESHTMRMTYNKNNNRLAVGLVNGQVKIFECNM